MKVTQYCAIVEALLSCEDEAFLQVWRINSQIFDLQPLNEVSRLLEAVNEPCNDVKNVPPDMSSFTDISCNQLVTLVYVDRNPAD